MANKEEILLTAAGYVELEEELNELRTTKREENIQAIKEARSHGDLSENSEYDAARDEQAKIEARIQELEYKLEHATIIDAADKSSVNVGCVVTILYVEDDEEETYSIVGSLEADPFENKISNESPIGAALIGKKVGDVINVDGPNGSYEVKITKIA
ncbi:MAG: transcription elongation factor GreA [Bacilli bacterium]|nr:transcription elongation factor GreA [Bacilli bacterium]